MKDMNPVLLATGLIVYALIALLSLDHSRENQRPSLVDTQPNDAQRQRVAK